MFPEPFVSRAKAPPAKRSRKGDGDENGDVFERGTATGSDLFSYLTCLHTNIFILLSIFSIGEKVSLKIRERLMSWRAKCSVPVLVRGSKTWLA